MYAPHMRRSAVDMPNSGISHSEASRRLGVAWKSHAKKTRRGCQNQTVVSICQKAAVARMDSFVGPKY
ncbi:hypothetical protein AB0I72_04530 [Nocardiopsis sp. NPDC049922]|uniref:hypothetical protein n=1 Tax=Nocardiopsis sp. NPDC049922 TaxID=3155157 RepID=UPI0033F4439F